MDSKMKLVAIACASMVVATILGIVALLQYGGKNQPFTPPLKTMEEANAENQETMGQRDDVYEQYQLDPSKDPYAFMADEDFFDSEQTKELPIVKKGAPISLLVSSVQKDIRIHVVDQEGNLLTGQEIKLTVKDEEGNEVFVTDDKNKKTSVFLDDDQDGILYLSDISAGEYEITMRPMKGFLVPSKPTSIKVSNDITYAALDDIAFLIRSEDEIDAAVEDSAQKEAEEDADGTEVSTRLEDGASIFGIDVSKWNKKIDWELAKQAGVEFAIIRCGYRGSQTGALVEDPYFKQNIEGAIKAGVRVGIYFFTQAITPVEAVEEASMVLALCKGYKVSFPMYIDTEGAGGNGRADQLSVEDRTACIKAFCETIDKEGKKAGVYASKHWFENRLHTNELKKYEIWLAQYSKQATYEGEYGMWQYTSAGKVDGITTLVDFDVSYMDY